MAFGENASGEADNQQGSRQLDLFDDWLTPQRLHAELLAASNKSLKTRADRNQDEDIVHAPWRHGEPHEQGSRTGRCGWITSFLRRPKSRLLDIKQALDGLLVDH